jgi:hypothetical protein
MISGLSSAGNEIKHRMLQKGGIGYNNTIYEKGLSVRIVKNGMDAKSIGFNYPILQIEAQSHDR